MHDSLGHYSTANSKLTKDYKVPSYKCSGAQTWSSMWTSQGKSPVFMGSAELHLVWFDFAHCFYCGMSVKELLWLLTYRCLSINIIRSLLRSWVLTLIVKSSWCMPTCTASYINSHAMLHDDRACMQKALFSSCSFALSTKCSSKSDHVWYPHTGCIHNKDVIKARFLIVLQAGAGGQIWSLQNK